MNTYFAAIDIRKVTPRRLRGDGINDIVAFETFFHFQTGVTSENVFYTVWRRHGR